MPRPGLDHEEAVAYGKGVTAHIHLAEPFQFLRGFPNVDDECRGGPVVLGSLHLCVQETNIGSVTLKLKGAAVIRWPGGIPPRRSHFEENHNFVNRTLRLFQAHSNDFRQSTSASHTQLSTGTGGASQSRGICGSFDRFPLKSTAQELRRESAKRVTLFYKQVRKFVTAGSFSHGPHSRKKEYLAFLPGDYLYNFELPLDSRLPETTDVSLGTIRYKLEAIIEGCGLFGGDLVGTKTITLIRAPVEDCLKHVEPSATRGTCKDWLQWRAVISGQSFPLGSQIPISIKLVPMVAVRCDWIKVLIRERVELFNSDGAKYVAPPREVELLGKRAGGRKRNIFRRRDVRITPSCEILPSKGPAIPGGEDLTSADLDPTNLFYDLSASDTVTEPMEMKLNAQLPGCPRTNSGSLNMSSDVDTNNLRMHVRHWIRVSPCERNLA